MSMAGGLAVLLAAGLLVVEPALGQRAGADHERRGAERSAPPEHGQRGERSARSGRERGERPTVRERERDRSSARGRIDRGSRFLPPPGCEHIFVAGMSSGEAQAISEAAALDEGEQAVVEALVSQYEQAVHDAVEEAKRQLDSLPGARVLLASARSAGRESGVTPNDLRSSAASINAVTSRLSEQRAELYAQLKADVGVVLPAEKSRLWRWDADRTWREQALGRGELSGEALNLYTAAEMAELEPQHYESVRSLLDAYESAIDEALRQRDHALVNTELLLRLSVQLDDADRVRSLMMGRVGARQRVRDLNEQYLEEVAAALPEDVGTRLRKTGRTLAYPRVFVPTPVQRLMAAAVESADLTDEQRQQVLDLQASYLRELQGIKESIMAAIRQSEPQERIASQVALAQPGHDNARSGSVESAFAPRQQLDRAYLAQLEELLPQELLAQARAAARMMGRTATRDANSRMLRQYDRNGDGVIDESERTRASTIREAQKRGGQRRPPARGAGGSGGSRGR